MPRPLTALIAASAMMVPTFTLFLVVASIVSPMDELPVSMAVLTGALYGLFAAVVAAVVMVLYAMPFYLFLTWMEWDNLFTCLLIALAPSLLILFTAEEYSPNDLIGFVVFLLHSLVAAITFWWVAKEPRRASTEPG